MVVRQPVHHAVLTVSQRNKSRHCVVGITISGGYSRQLLPTSVPGDRSICIKASAVIGVSSVSLLVIVTLITVILTQCLLILRMRKSKDVLHSNETYAEPSMHDDVDVSNEAYYALHKISDEDTYEMVK